MTFCQPLSISGWFALRHDQRPLVLLAMDQGPNRAVSVLMLVERRHDSSSSFSRVGTMLVIDGVSEQEIPFKGSTDTGESAHSSDLGLSY